MRRLILEQGAVYHCISRTVGGQFLLDTEAKEVFRRMMWKVADFCGVEVLTYCLMSNHFHILVRVTERPESIAREELLRRYKVLYATAVPTGFPSVHELAKMFAEEGIAAENWERRLTSRMGSLAEFMRTLKHRFSRWYNKSHQRFGTLWAERYTSVIVEDSPQALTTVGAYIDLNPVRAGLVEDPARYRWCGYAETLAGRERALRGLMKIMRCDGKEEATASYRLILFGKGSMSAGGSGTIADELLLTVERRQGRVSVHEFLRNRIRYFSDGCILGSESFVRSLGERLQSRTGTSGERILNRRLGWIAMRRASESEDKVIQGLASWRNLQNSVVSKPLLTAKPGDSEALV